MHRVQDDEHKEAESSATLYRGSLPPLDLHGKTVLLVDEALIDPSPLASTVLRLRALGAQSVVIAVPVGSLLAIEKVRPVVQEVVCLCQRAACHDLGQRFGELQLVSEEAVVHCMKEEGEEEGAGRNGETNRDEGNGK